MPKKYKNIESMPPEVINEMLEKVSEVTVKGIMETVEKIVELQKKQAHQKVQSLSMDFKVRNQRW